MNVQVVKMTTGEEIIANVVDNGSELTLSNPMLVAVQDGRLVFIPYMQYTSAAKEIILDKKHVMFIVTPVESLVDDFHNATETVTKPRKSITSSVP